MDRDNRWDRVQKAYDAIVHGEGQRFRDPLTVFKASYAAGVTDEFIVPALVVPTAGSRAPSRAAMP